MRVFRTKNFARFQRKERIDDATLISKEDERDLKDYGGMILALDVRGIAIMIRGNELTEVDRHGEE